MLKIKKIIGLIGISVICLSMPVCAVGFDDTVRDNNKISTEIIVEHNLDDGTITEKTYVINSNFAHRF